ncbi:nuclear transport factor 2 family protein [Oxalobacteraceae bacterium]|nr:nuclear transport factor 2 family protein [Oxalobacteraceae bacterium]
MPDQLNLQTARDAIAEQIRAIERTRLQALVEGDMAVARPLHAPDFQLITPIGKALSKEDYLGAITGGHIAYLKWQPEEMEVRVHPRVALLRYQAELELVFGAYHVPSARYWHTDAYELRGDVWQVVWSQATAIK